MAQKLWSIEDVRQDPELLGVVRMLLLQMADDDLIMGFRDQEWLGLAPHIEEDVAFGSIGQEEIGHAAHYYQLLETLGDGSADDLASLRPVEERRNNVLVEQPNGTGGYLDDPHYNWAWTIVRHYFHDVWEMLRLEGLMEGRIEPLADVARKVLGEKRYHRAHQELWIKTMADHPAAQERLREALGETARWAKDVSDFGPVASAVHEMGIIPRADLLVERFQSDLGAFFHRMNLDLPPFEEVSVCGRWGQHTPALSSALRTLSEVYRLDPAAQW